MRRTALVLAFALISSPALAAGGHWETITSPEGGFTIDMPAKPTKKESESRPSPFGQSRFFMLSCHTDDGAFIVFRIDFPVGLPGGVEQRILDSTRDTFAQRWRGRVVSEKRVTARGSPGRDFTIRGNPEGTGISFVRVRQYLIGHSMFAVAVVSAPNQELPEETGRFLGSLTLGESRQRATGTPEPDPPGRSLPGWGMAIDPDGDCKFTPANRGIRIEVPTTIHDLGGPKRIFNAPRVMQDVDGDFTITVKVIGQLRPGPQSSNPGSFPYNGAGIVVWSDSDNFIRLERAAVLRGGSVLTNLAFLEHEGGYGGANHSDALGNSDCFLRVRRKGSRIYAGVSTDGNNWRWLRPIDTIWPSKLKVGLTAITTSSTPFLAKFEEYEFRADALPPAAGGAGFTPPTVPRPPVNRPNTGAESTPFAPTVVNSPNPASSSSSSTKSRRTMIVVIAVVCGLLVLVALAGLGGVGLWMLIASKPTPAERPTRPSPRGRRID